MTIHREDIKQLINNKLCMIIHREDIKQLINNKEV